MNLPFPLTLDDHSDILDAKGVAVAEGCTFTHHLQELVDSANSFKVIERAATEDNWAEFVTPVIYLIIERIKAKCCKQLMRECAEKSKTILAQAELLEEHGHSSTEGAGRERE